MKKVGTFIVAVVCIALVCGGFYLVVQRSNQSGDADKKLTEIEKLIAKDLDKTYPNTPREVVKLYNRIITCYYRNEYTEEELESLADQALLLMDEQLRANNPKSDYVAAIKADVLEFSEDKKILAQSEVCDSNDVKYITDGEDKLAYVTTSYFVKGSSKCDKTYEQFVLRKDSQENWRILCYYKIEGVSSESDN